MNKGIFVHQKSTSQFIKTLYFFKKCSIIQIRPEKINLMKCKGENSGRRENDFEDKMFHHITYNPSMLKNILFIGDL